MEINYNKKIHIYFSYNITVQDSIIIDLQYRSKSIRTREVFIESINLTTYKQFLTTVTKNDYTYSFPYVTQSMIDFFQNAVNAEKQLYEITHGIEQNDGSILEYTCLLKNFTYDDKTVTIKNGQKFYKDLSIEVLEV